MKVFGITWWSRFNWWRGGMLPAVRQLIEAFAISIAVVVITAGLPVSLLDSSVTVSVPAFWVSSIRSLMAPETGASLAAGEIDIQVRGASLTQRLLHVGTWLPMIILSVLVAWLLSRLLLGTERKGFLTPRSVRTLTVLALSCGIGGICATALVEVSRSLLAASLLGTNPQAPDILNTVPIPWLAAAVVFAAMSQLIARGSLLPARPEEDVLRASESAEP